MTIKDCIDVVDNSKPNQYSVKDKVMWLSDLDETIINDVIKTHEGYDGRYDLFEGYSEDKLTTTLVVRSPHDRLYVAYLKMMIDKENGETQRYNASASVYNGYYMEFRKYYNKTHLPITRGMNSLSKPINKRPGEGLTDAQYESLKRDLTFILQEHFADVMSDDKVYDIVMKYVQSNSDMLKGKDGKTPIVGQDFWTDADIRSIVEEVISSLKADIEHLVVKHSYSKAEVDAGLNSKANIDDVYTKDIMDHEFRTIEIAWDTLSKNKAGIATVYTKKQVDYKLESKADADKVYTKEEVDSKIDVISSEVGNRYTKEEVDNKLEEIGGSVDAYTKAEIDEKLKNPSYEEQVKLKGITTATPMHDGASVDINDNSVSSDGCVYDINVQGNVSLTCECTFGWSEIIIDGKTVASLGDTGVFTYSFEGEVKSGITVRCSMTRVTFTKFVKKIYVSEAIGNIELALDELHNYATSLIGGEA